MAELVVPQLGESISEAVVARWLKRVGDAVALDEPVAELETDKVTVQLPSPVAGALSEQRVKEGATVKVGDVLGAVEAGKAGKAAAPAPKAAAAPAPVAKPAPTPAQQVQAVPTGRRHRRWRPSPVAAPPKRGRAMANRSIAMRCSS